MGFNSFRQNLYRFFSKEEKEQHSAVYPFLNKRIFKLSKRFKSKEPVEKGIEFFFYTDEMDKANNLVIELAQLGYEIYDVRPPTINELFSITGCNRTINFEEEEMTIWTEQMIALGYKCDCQFDGWGTLL